MEPQRRTGCSARLLVSETVCRRWQVESVFNVTEKSHKRRGQA